MNVDMARARALHLAGRIGPFGWSGMALLVAGAALLAIAQGALKPANRAGAAELSQLQDQLAHRKLAGASLADAPDPVAMIVAQLPAADRVPAFVQEVQAQAARRNLQIERTEYRVQKALGGRALRYQLSMPAHGRYPDLRGWLETLLHEHPSAALDELSLRRETQGGEQLEAHVALSFYSQGVH